MLPRSARSSTPNCTVALGDGMQHAHRIYPDRSEWTLHAIRRSWEVWKESGLQRANTRRLLQVELPEAIAKNSGWKGASSHTKITKSGVSQVLNIKHSTTSWLTKPFKQQRQAVRHYVAPRRVLKLQVCGNNVICTTHDYNILA